MTEWGFRPIDVPVVDGVATLDDGTRIECAPGVDTVRTWVVSGEADAEEAE